MPDDALPYWVREYALVVRGHSDPQYVSPYDPACLPGARYLAVHPPAGDWGIVDRQTGKLLGRHVPGAYRYVYRAEVEQMVARLNNGEQPDLRFPD